MCRAAVFTGLRRGESSRPRVRHLKLDREVPRVLKAAGIEYQDGEGGARTSTASE